MSKNKPKSGVILNKFGKEKPLPKLYRLLNKQCRKVEKYADRGDRSQFVRDAIDAFTPAKWPLEEISS